MPQYRDIYPDMLRKGIAYTTGKDLSFYGFSKISLLRLSFYQRNYRRAQEILEELQLLNRNKWFPQYMVHIMIYWQVRMLLLHGETGQALDLFNTPGKANSDDDHTLFEPLALARALIAQEEFEKARQQLARFEEKAFANGHVNRLIEIYVLQALLYDAQHKQQQSRDALSRAVQFAEPGGFVSVFLMEGQPMARLLYQLLPFTGSSDYVQSLLAAFGAKETAPQVNENAPDDTAEYIEPLSEREFDMLQLLANGLSNQEIAARLYLSLNTVKAHTRNIY